MGEDGAVLGDVLVEQNALPHRATTVPACLNLYGDVASCPDVMTLARKHVEEN
jgi:hypothetical protein